MFRSRAVGFVRGMRQGGVVCLLMLFLTAPVPAAEPEVGTAVLVRKKVTATLGSDERQLETGLRVHRNELLQTGPQAQAELKLDDDTKLALGPDAELRLDEYAVATGTDTKTIAVKFLKGTFRFLTGTNSSDSYKIETPSATIGVRGTIFDVYIGPSGDTFVLLHQGEVEVCSRARTCRPHRDVGRVVQATVPGIISQPMKWSTSLVPGVAVAQVFPFVGKRLAIDPVRRLTHNTIAGRVVDPAVKGTKRVIEQGGATIGKTLRKLSPF